METVKFTFAFFGAFTTVLWILWLILVYPYSNISLKSYWYGTFAGSISAILIVILVAAAFSWKD